MLFNKAIIDNLYELYEFSYIKKLKLHRKIGIHYDGEKKPPTSKNKRRDEEGEIAAKGRESDKKQRRKGMVVFNFK